MKRVVRQTINNYLKGRVRITERDLDRDVMEKKLFTQSLLLLQEIDDRRDFMEAELGVDMTQYEEKFLQVIENLFKIHFSKEQLALIQYYIYQVPLLDNWDGKIDLSDGKTMITVDFETPEQVWNVINSIKKLRK
jgi:hypothetical protein